MVNRKSALVLILALGVAALTGSSVMTRMQVLNSAELSAIVGGQDVGTDTVTVTPPPLSHCGPSTAACGDFRTDCSGTTEPTCVGGCYYCDTGAGGSTYKICEAGTVPCTPSGDTTAACGNTRSKGCKWLPPPDNPNGIKRCTCQPKNYDPSGDKCSVTHCS